MALLTSFRASGRCSNCHAEGEVWIQCRIGSLGLTYRVDDDISTDINLYEIESTSFLVRQPAPDEAIHVLTAWSCDTCSFEGFAEVVFADGKVRDIQPVDLTPATLERLHYVITDIDYKLEVFLGRSMWDEHGVWPQWLSTLRAVLAGGSPPVEELPAAPPTAPAQAPTPAPVAAPEDLEDPFPLGYTIGDGRYEVDQLYLGGGANQLCFGHSSDHAGVRYLISTAPNNGLDADKVGRDIMRAAPGMFVPRFLGGYDAPFSTVAGRHCVFVEELPPGSPLRQALPSPRAHAVQLGAQIGRLLGRAATEAGVLNVGLRPEYVWVTVEGGVPTVTGLGGRNRAFFASAARRRDLPTAPLFTLRYGAPEIARGEPYDDRALVITLAVMVTEWIVGTYPYLPGDGEWGYLRLCKGEHVEIPAEPPLAALLASALRPDPADRPDLATFTSALAAFARR